LLFLVPMAVFSQVLHVRSIVFKGNRSFSDHKLSKIIKTHEGEVFHTRLLKLDQMLLKNFYQLQGFLNVYVEATFRKRMDKITVIYKILEGKRYYLKSLVFHGNHIISTRRLKRFFQLREGQFYNPIKIEEGLNAIENYYLDHGKPFVSLKPNTQIIQDSLLVVTVEIQEGHTVRIKNISFEGLKWVKSFIIRRELEIHKGTFIPEAS